MVHEVGGEMARTSYESQVRSLAKKLGVEVSTAHGPDGFEVELWGYTGHMSFDGAGHTAITNQVGTGIETVPGIWEAALNDLKMYAPCDDDCHCRDAVSEA